MKWVNALKENYTSELPNLKQQDCINSQIDDSLSAENSTKTNKINEESVASRKMTLSKIMKFQQLEPIDEI